MNVTKSTNCKTLVNHNFNTKSPAKPRGGATPPLDFMKNVQKCQGYIMAPLKATFGAVKRTKTAEKGS